MDDFLFYRRHLPHIEAAGKTYFVTFRTCRGSVLSASSRTLVLNCCRYIHNRTAFLHCALVMPDHVHILMTPQQSDTEDTTLLRRIMKGIKGVSARQINAASGRHGPVWQSEWFDHILRNHESADAKLEYIRMNPVRKGLCSNPEDYEWYWEQD